VRITERYGRTVSMLDLDLIVARSRSGAGRNQPSAGAWA